MYRKRKGSCLCDGGKYKMIVNIFGNKENKHDWTLKYNRHIKRPNKCIMAEVDKISKEIKEQEKSKVIEILKEQDK